MLKGPMNFFRGEKCKGCGHRKCRCSIDSARRRARNHGAISQMPNTTIFFKDPESVEASNKKAPAPTKLHTSSRSGISQPGDPSSSKLESKRCKQNSSRDQPQRGCDSDGTELDETPSRPLSASKVGQSSRPTHRSKQIMQTFPTDQKQDEISDTFSRSGSTSKFAQPSGSAQEMQINPSYTSPDQVEREHGSDNSQGTRDSIKSPASSISNHEQHNTSKVARYLTPHPSAKAGLTTASMNQIQRHCDIANTEQSIISARPSTATRQRQSAALGAVRKNLGENNYPWDVSAHDPQASSRSSKPTTHSNLPSRIQGQNSSSKPLRDGPGGPARFPCLETDSVLNSWNNLHQGLNLVEEAAEEEATEEERAGDIGVQNPADAASVRSILTTPHDIKMAGRQTSIDKLSAAEQKEQESWAQSQLKQNASKSCPAGLIWIRYGNGYRCLAGAHYVSDELLAGGKGGYYNHGLQIRPGRKIRKSWGPFYGADPRLGKLSPKEAAKLRKEVFGKENPTVEDCLW